VKGGAEGGVKGRAEGAAEGGAEGEVGGVTHNPTVMNSISPGATLSPLPQNPIDCGRITLRELEGENL
jgi:hypothetical protein